MLEKSIVGAWDDCFGSLVPLAQFEPTLFRRQLKSEDGNIIVVKKPEASDIVMFMDETLDVKSRLSASIN